MVGTFPFCKIYENFQCEDPNSDKNSIILGVKMLKFKSKIDWWLAIIIWGSMIFSIGIGIYAIFTKNPSLLDLILTTLLAIMLPIGVLWMCLTTFYVIEDNVLIIQYGPFKKLVQLDSIQTVRKTNNPLSSPALSLKRLEITYGKYDMVLISPKKRDEFIALLAKSCPNANINIDKF